MYSEFLSLVRSGNVRACRFEEAGGSSGQRITFDVRPHSSAAAAVQPRSTLYQMGAGPSSTQQGVAGARASAASPTVSAGVAVDAATAAALQGGGGEAVVRVRGQGPSPRQFYTKRLAADPSLLPLLMSAGVEFGVMRTSFTSALVRWA